MVGIFFVIIAFLVVIFFIVRPLSLKLPGGRTLRLDYAAGSIIGASLLFLLNVITPHDALTLLVGREGFSPYTIIILFMSVAYIAISLDSTGFFEYVALKLVLRSGGNGRKLFFYFYFLGGFVTLFTSNDIVILTLTPIIFYFGKHAKIKVLPYLIAEFFAANIWSMFLYIGNPTNIIAASAAGIGLIEYSVWMILPTLAAGLSCFALLYFFLGKEVNMRFRTPHVNPNDFMKDKRCAFVTLVVFCLTLATLTLSPFIGLEMWLVSLFFAVSLFIYDTGSAFSEYYKEHMTYYSVFRSYFHKPSTKIYQFRLHMIAERMPWKIVPFLLCSFIMVEGLVVIGFTDAAASWFSAISSNIFIAVLSMGFLSSFAANLINNQPMTVLFTKITDSSQFALAGNAKLASVFSLIIGSNLGANITLIGALAGIMWIKILRDKHQTVTYRGFAKLGLLVTPLVILAACGTLALEFFLFG